MNCNRFNLHLVILDSLLLFPLLNEANLLMFFQLPNWKVWCPVLSIQKTGARSMNPRYFTVLNINFRVLYESFGCVTGLCCGRAWFWKPRVSRHSQLLQQNNPSNEFTNTFNQTHSKRFSVEVLPTVSFQCHVCLPIINFLRTKTTFESTGGRRRWCERTKPRKTRMSKGGCFTEPTRTLSMRFVGRTSTGECVERMPRLSVKVIYVGSAMVIYEVHWISTFLYSAILHD